jgi:uncharacterized protein GlcG (DUF336 family)
MITLAQAKNALAAAETKAKELGITVSIAVVDEYGTLVAFSRMDGALKISPEFARTKAFTAGTLGFPTEGLAPYATVGKPYHDITALFGGELTTIAGGEPVMLDGKLAGGVGVGGSNDVSQDAECAKAGVAAIV